MRFDEPHINEMDLHNSPELIIELLHNDFCGEPNEIKLDKNEREIIFEVTNNFEKNGINFEQFNELLLLLNQPTVGRDFFSFFFGDDLVSIPDLKNGIIKFRGYALLCFGNFRFAFKKLINLSVEQIRKTLGRLCTDPEDLEVKLKNRPPKMLDIKKIPKENTWYTGFLSGKLVEDDLERLEKEKENRDSYLTKEDITYFEDYLVNIGREIEKAQEDALHNTDVYLTWEYMDVYIATSMRHLWEFEEVFGFIQTIESNLNRLNIRFFDPTQSNCENARDKGLMESLMIKRAFSTIYLAQETETMGKDSELAATLAQSKPVIAYVPHYEAEEYSEKISKYPLEFFKIRLYSHMAHGTFEDSDYKEKSKFSDNKQITIIDNFLKKYREYRIKQPFKLFYKKDHEFKENYNDFKAVCYVLAEAECFGYDKRAMLLKGRHPLAMQADLTTGVANGVIVTRNPKQSIEILKQLIQNKAKFKIVREENYTALVEKDTDSIFRVITKNKRLTNSFWNYFLK